MKRLIVGVTGSSAPQLGYAMLQALRTLRPDDDPMIAARYPDPAPQARARHHERMERVIERTAGARRRFEARVEVHRRALLTE